MATGKITKRTLDALQANAVAGFLWDEDLKGLGLANHGHRSGVLCDPISNGWPRSEKSSLHDR